MGRQSTADTAVARGAADTGVARAEAFVAERVLRACAALHYPRGCLSLQVLDDSTDETQSIVARVAKELEESGLSIEVLRRSSRTGFKAGALAHGLERSDAELVCVFDADFVPPPDFLLRSVPVLAADPLAAFVQARWGHLNRENSLLTRAHALFLDGHFVL